MANEQFYRQHANKRTEVTPTIQRYLSGHYKIDSAGDIDTTREVGRKNFFYLLKKYQFSRKRRTPPPITHTKGK